MHIRFADDGRGLALRMIKEIARVQGIRRHEEELSENDVLQLICQPGFSTSQAVNEISGRGVGMSAVKSFVESAGGNLELVLIKDRQNPDSNFQAFAIEIKIPQKFYRVFYHKLPVEQAKRTA